MMSFTPSSWAKEVTEKKNPAGEAYMYYLLRLMHGESVPKFMLEK